nr:SDR family oxidoreductase [Streptomyces phaeoluteigriseus]
MGTSRTPTRDSARHSCAQETQCTPPPGGAVAPQCLRQVEGAGRRAGETGSGGCSRWSSAAVCAVDRPSAADFGVCQNKQSVQEVGGASGIGAELGEDPPATHYLGVIAVIRAASRVLRTGGRIIAVSSGVGSRVGAPGLADYSASKSGIERYTMGVARAFGPRNITADVVEAGLMEGGMQPPDPETLTALVSSLSLQRMGHPDEMAAAITFLASPARVVRHGRGARRPQRLQRLNPNPCAAPRAPCPVPRRTSCLPGAHRRRPATRRTAQRLCGCAATALHPRAVLPQPRPRGGRRGSRGRRVRGRLGRWRSHQRDSGGRFAQGPAVPARVP